VILAFILAIGITSIFLFFKEYIIGKFTSDSEMAAKAGAAFPMLCLSMLFDAVIFA